MKELNNQLHHSQYRLRKYIGVLGIALPVILLLNHDCLLFSMSHYYYTSASVFFIAILFAFGMILLAYRGHPFDKEREYFLSDQTATTLASICIFITLLIPTRWEGAFCSIYFENDSNYLFGHNSSIKGVIHLISGGMFFLLLGYMSFCKFPLGKGRKLLYKICGLIIFISVISLVVCFYIDSQILYGNLNSYFPSYAFWIEMIAVWAFAVSWLVKGRFYKEYITK